MPADSSAHPLKKLLPWIAAVTGGILVFLGYAGFDQFYLEWIALVPVLWAVRRATPRHAFLIGWLAGIVAHVGGFYWAIGMFRQFAGAPWPVALGGLLALATANGIVLATWAWGTRFITRATGWSVVWVAPVIWTAAEKLWPQQFPNYLGASQYLAPRLTQIADLTGILGVSFLVVYINATIYLLLVVGFEERRLARRELVSLLVVVILVLGYGEFRLRTLERTIAAAEKLRVGLVQTNRGAGDKGKDPIADLREHQEMSRALAQSRPLDLIVWPEGVCRVALTSSREGRLPPELHGNVGIPLLVGAVLETWDGREARTWNTALLADPTGLILGSYDKRVLVPLGEYIPLGDRIPVLYSWFPYISRFWAGESDKPLRLGKHLLSVNICYEDIFPTRIRALMRGGGEDGVPGAMFNLTNDSWYGNSTEPIEHLALASFRSIEHRRSLVRATNTGISAFVDPAGRIVSRTGVWTKESLVASVPLLQGRTLYALLGDWIGWLCALFSAWCLLRSRRIQAARAPVTGGRAGAEPEGKGRGPKKRGSV